MTCAHLFTVSSSTDSGEMALQLRALDALAGQGFDSQHPHGSSQLSVTSAPRDTMPSSCLHGKKNIIVQTYMQVKHLYI